MSSIRSAALLGLALAVVTPALAAPRSTAPQLVQIELDQAQARKLQLIRHKLPQATVEPGGLEITPNADPDWLTVGFKVGDLIVAENGHAVGERLILHEGVYMFDVIRNKKLVVVRLVIHPSPRKTRVLDEDRYDKLLDVANTPNDPHSTPVRGPAGPSGVRVIDTLLGLYMDAEVGDLIRSIDGLAIKSDAELTAAIQNLRIGNTEVQLERNGKPITLTLIRKAPLDLTTIKKLSPTKYEVTQAFAAAVAADHDILTRKINTTPHLTNGKPNGFAVYDVHPESPAAKLGILDGDIVLDFDGHPINNLSEVIDASHALEHATSMSIHLLRKGKPVTLSYTVR